jgi:hypothetical protein
MKFSELSELAEKVRKKTGEYTSVSIISNHFESGNTETEYTFYRETFTHGSIRFKTVQELRAHMENLLTPPIDEGVEIESEAA